MRAAPACRLTMGVGGVWPDYTNSAFFKNLFVNNRKSLRFGTFALTHEKCGLADF